MKRLRSRGVLLATLLAFVLISTGAVAVFFATPAQAHSSTVTVLNGSVQVRHAGGAFAPITDGDIVVGGDTVRTGASSHSVLTFFDGTTVELEPDTELRIDSLQASASGDKIVELTQAIGRTWHVVTHLVSSRSKYEIRTPVSTAAVRGTAFQVTVSPDGSTSTDTTEGDVSTIAQGGDVHVLAGQTNVVTRGLPPELPTPSPEPSATVRIVLDLTRNAIVTDENGRSVGVQNGLPIRYIPGSKVEIIDGRLVITIPNAQLGRLRTSIRPDPGFAGSTPGAVTIQTQVIVKGLGIVANSLVSRPVVNGVAKDEIVVTEGGLQLVSNDDARNAPVPHIGKAPAPPTGILPIRSAPTMAPLVTVALAPASPVDATTALDVTTAAFLPYSTVATVAATTTIIAPAPVNGGVVPVVASLAPIVQTVIAPVTSIVGGILSPASATPAPVTLPTNAFATPTPAIVVDLPVLNGALPTIAVPISVPTVLPVVGGFVPPLVGLVPTAPVATAVATPVVPIVAGPTPTVPPVVVAPIVTAPPATQAPTAPPPVNVSVPPVTSAPVPTAAPTQAPTTAPTPAPTPAPLRICLPLLGCL